MILRIDMSQAVTHARQASIFYLPLFFQFLVLLRVILVYSYLLSYYDAYIRLVMIYYYNVVI